MTRYAIITGASSGIGKACAEKFAQNGWNLILTARRIQRLEALQKELKALNIDIHILEMDVRKEDEVKKIFASLPKNIQLKVELLINNAGLAAGRESIELGDSKDWEQMIDTNIKGLLYVSQTVIPWMKEQKKGHIINISSIAGKEVYPSGAVYCASKFGVEAITKGMRMDLLPHKIRVTSIAPGAVETEFSLVRFKWDSQKADAVYEGYEPLRATDIAETIFFAASLPDHVCINDLTIMPTAQATSTQFHKG